MHMYLFVRKRKWPDVVLQIKNYSQYFPHRYEHSLLIQRWYQVIASRLL